MSDHPLATHNLIAVTELSPGAIADRRAAERALSDYQQTLSANSLRRQKTDLRLFAQFLRGVGIEVTETALMENPASWRDITYGLVRGFVEELLDQGYAIASINSRLATVKRYCAVAAKAGEMTASALALIHEVKGFSHKQGRNVDETRAVTRLGPEHARPGVPDTYPFGV